MESKIESVIKMIKRLSNDDQDPSVRHFFSVLFQISEQSCFRNILIKILKERSNITEEHLAYLIFISFQYLTDFDYDKKNDKEKLQKDLIKYSGDIVKLCKTKYASTNIFERYSFLQIILAMINRRSVVIDLGASMGLGLMSLNTDIFSDLKVDPKLSRYLNKRVDISKAIGVDIQRPDLKWQLACYLPQSKENRIKLKTDYERQKNQGTIISLTQGDITKLDRLNLPNADVIWTSNTIYEVEGNLRVLKENIYNLLKKDGIWINTDYRHEDRAFATKENPYVAMVRRKEDWNRILEVLESPSDVVRSIEPGRDFETFRSVCG